MCRAQLSVDEDEQWAPWTALQDTAFATQAPNIGGASLQTASFAGSASASITIPTPNTATTTSNTAAGAQQAGASSSRGNDVAQQGQPVATGSAGAGSHLATPPFASAASSMGTSGSMAAKVDAAQLAKIELPSDLDWDALWGGPRSAWDMTALKRGIVPGVPSTSPPTLASPSTAPSHMSTKPSQDGLSDVVGGAASLDTDHTAASHSSLISAPAGTARHTQFPRSGPPLVARSRAPRVKCEVPIWLPDANGTVAAMGASGRCSVSACSFTDACAMFFQCTQSRTRSREACMR